MLTTRGFAKSRSRGPAFLFFRKGDGPTATEIEPQFDQLRTLTEISRALTYTTSLDEVTRLTVERGCNLLDAEAAALWLLNDVGALELRSSHGLSPEKLQHSQSPVSHVQLASRLALLFELAEDRLIAVPLIVGGVVTGVLAAGLTRPSNAADEWLLSALGDQASVALENARVDAEVRTQLAARLLSSEGSLSAKDRALSTLAHDIRTPLGAIDAYCSILEDELLGTINDRQRETLGRVRMSGRHLLSLLDNVMEMARINAGAVRMNMEEFRLVDAARDAMQMLVPASDAKFQVIQLIEDDVGEVCADQARVRQILVNLIGNAVKFTPADGTITVTVRRTTQNDEPLSEVQITDSGPGIAPEERLTIFEPYYRSEATATSPGVGLGLAICAGLVAQMKGSLLVTSELGHGATFTLQLPAREGACD